MARPTADEVEGPLSALDYLRSVNQLVAYPVTIDGCRVIVLGQSIRKASGTFDAKPVMVVCTDELAAKMDLTEART